MAKLPLTLQTRLGRRIALLFVVSALVPLAVMAVQGYAQVRSRLIDESQLQLQRAAKNVGMGIVGQLNGAENILIELPHEHGSPGPASRTGVMATERARSTFASLAVVGRGAPRVLWGRAPRVELSPEEARRIADGRLVVRLDEAHRVWMVAPYAGGRQVWGALDTAYLFNGARSRAAADTGDVILCVRAVGANARLLCPDGPSASSPLSASWDVFLNYDFGVPPWRVEVSEPMAAVLAPVDAFRRTFALSIVTVVGLVVLLTSVQVRRSLQPLDELQRGMQRLRRRDFSGTVSVSSGDEFEDLAQTFNRMAGEIDEQFRTITAGSAIDQTALISRRGEDVAATAAARLRAALQCERVDVYVAGERPSDAWRCIRAVEGAVQIGREVWPPTAELERLRLGSRLWLRDDGAGFAWMQNGSGDPSAGAVLTLVSHGELVGLVALYTSGVPSETQVRVARQLGDQLSVGLANSRLITRLNGLSYGAVAALARTVDANSHWTAGHSERVTAMSLRMGRRLQLPEGELDTLRRGGLLHDIGKIGVPSAVLDFAGPLDGPGLAIIRAHPGLGTKILSPIAAFADAIPIVLYHHERVDGMGYPEGLKGGEIPFPARLLAVADVYDALVSDRPYRPGWSTTLAIDTIRGLSGTHFDAAMVDAFLGVIAVEGDGARFATDPLALAETAP